MTRIVFRGGRVFDGTGADPAPADVAVEDDRIVGIGPGLDGDTEIDVREPRSIEAVARHPRGPCIRGAGVERVEASNQRVGPAGPYACRYADIHAGCV